MGVPRFLRYILVGIPVGITFIDTVGTVARVEGISMQPSLNPNNRENDYVFLSTWAIRGYNIHRGDIVSFISPRSPDEILIKRIIGLAGDFVRSTIHDAKVFQVPDGQCWVEGDNIGYSRDSNSFGPISVGLIKAKATCIVWPPNRWQLLNNVSPNNRYVIKVDKSAAF